jgi:hypothetical protein
MPELNRYDAGDHGALTQISYRCSIQQRLNVLESRIGRGHSGDLSQRYDLGSLLLEYVFALAYER